MLLSVWIGVLLVAAAAVAVLVAVAAVVVVRRRRRGNGQVEPPAVAEAHTPTVVATSAPAGEPPKRGLESALDQTIDRAGRPIREAIDAGAAHVDQLRSPEDTGPLLGRALDEIAPDPDQVDDGTGSAGRVPDS